MLHEHHISVRRSARYYTLGDETSARGIVYAFHGYGQLAARFVARLRPLGDAGFLVVAPEALSRFYVRGMGVDREPQVGASWMTREDREHEIEDQIAYLNALHAHVAARTGTSAAPVSLLGFSQGVSTMARWLAGNAAGLRPHTIVAWAGKLPLELDEARLRDLLAGSRLFVVVGDADELAPAAEVAKEEERLRAAGIAWERITFAGGHELHAATLARIFAGQ